MNGEAMAQPPKRRIRWGLLIALALIAAVILGGILIVAGLASLAGGKAVTVKPDSTLVITLDRPLQEPAPDPILTEFFQARIYSVYDLEHALDKAAQDDRIKSVLLEISSFPSGFGKIQELRDSVERFRKSGKPVYAYFEATGNGGYVLASAADTVAAPPSAMLMMSGLLAEVPFYRGVLDKLHIEPQLYHIGDYKSYSDTFMRKDMSAAQKEAMDAILDSLYGQMVGAVASGRKLTPEEVKDDIDQGFLWGQQLKDRKLVDELWYHDQLEAALKKVNGNTGQWHRIGVTNYMKDQRVDPAAGASKTLALVIASGGIVSGEGQGSQVAMNENLGSDTVVKWLRKVGDDDDIKAVVLRVDSPGGSGLASDVIWRQVELLRKKKPVVVSMSDVAGSGGYYIAMGADAIVAQPGTITGSIGVVTGKFVTKGLFDWIDYNQETMKRGKNADMMTSYVRFNDEQEAIMRNQMTVFYRDFVTKAAEGRHMTYDQIDKIGQGRIWSGEDALKIGLVDKLGGIPTAIQLAKEKAGIKADERVRITVYPRPRTFFESLMQGKLDEVVAARQRAALPAEVQAALETYDRLRPFVQEPLVLYTTEGVRF